MRKQPETRRRRSPRRRLGYQQLSSRLLLAGDFHNESFPLDVDNSQSVTALDAMLLINGIASGEGISETIDGRRVYMDTSGNGELSPLDAILVINGIAQAEDVDIPGVASFSANGSDISLSFSGDNATLDVTASTRPNHLTFTTAGQSEDYPITDDFIVNATGQNLTLNITDATIPDDLIIRATGSGNQLNLNGVTIDDDFFFRGGSGADTITLANYTSIHGTATILTGRGNDSLIGTRSYVGNDLIAALGSDDDIIDLRASTVRENLRINVGADNDDVFLQRTNVHNDLFIEAEGGNDFLLFNRSYVSDDAIINLGSGDDQVDVFGTVVRDRTELDGESGRDLLFANDDGFIDGNVDVDGIEALAAFADPGEPILPVI